MGFFAEVGPLQIFVSIHLIPPDLKFYPDANPPNFSNEEQSILKGAMVRIKIMGLRMDVKDIVTPTPLIPLALRCVY
jgi:DNA-directed RNA polymerase II subunit RPB7